MLECYSVFGAAAESYGVRPYVGACFFLIQFGESLFVYAVWEFVVCQLFVSVAFGLFFDGVECSGFAF